MRAGRQRHVCERVSACRLSALCAGECALCAGVGALCQCVCVRERARALPACACVCVRGGRDTCVSARREAERKKKVTLTSRTLAIFLHVLLHVHNTVLRGLRAHVDVRGDQRVCAETMPTLTSTPRGVQRAQKTPQHCEKQRQQRRYPLFHQLTRDFYARVVKLYQLKCDFEWMSGLSTPSYPYESVDM